MQNEITPEPPNTPQTIQTEADALAARRVTQRLYEIARSGKRARYLSALGVTVMLVSQISALLIVLSFHDPYDWRDWIVFFLMLIGAFGGLGLAIRVSYRPPLWFNEAEAARRGGVQAVAPLFAALDAAPLKSERDAIYSTLTALLPQMKASDANFLTPAAHRIINDWLLTAFDRSATNGCPASLLIAALRALEQVGDSRNVFFVSQVANWTPRTLEDTEIRQAARECVPMLRANCQDTETARTLLRASQAEPTDPATLLRPASHSPETNPVELLRGSHSPDA